MNIILVVLAFVFALLATLIAGGIITGNLPWLLPASLASYFFALLAGYAVESKIFVKRAA
jgi:hypothetical protein